MQQCYQLSQPMHIRFKTKFPLLKHVNKPLIVCLAGNQVTGLSPTAVGPLSKVLVSKTLRLFNGTALDKCLLKCKYDFKYKNRDSNSCFKSAGVLAEYPNNN